MEQDLTYSAAYEELENIALEMENESVSIDELAVRVKRAAELIAFCQNKLRATEKEVAAVMTSMEEGKSAAKPGSNPANVNNKDDDKRRD
ncbi:exodeoxyribonuclease VII small subunit [Arachidicoccus terrestris]|uniref:exodeoxyribonuclease VII small subunit n=1 Tax=Arachidicoccus terrestris TaxID=2875539 RepID=UPI001CC69681|nr:exodeoxyribonuclease VII small subunit [Arachidicoccus terrestris]UAY55263.1 exodeoxyribonuclease VII small subunit [Arachidicoccus terrestris]